MNDCLGDGHTYVRHFLESGLHGCVVDGDDGGGGDTGLDYDDDGGGDAFVVP